MNISNNYPVMVFKKENKYTVGVSNKKQDGTYENAYFPIQFNKDVTLEDKTKIKINNAWLSFYKWEFEDKKGTTFLIKCNDFEIIEESNEAPKKEVKEEVDIFADFGNSISIEDDFLD